MKSRFLFFFGIVSSAVATPFPNHWGPFGEQVISAETDFTNWTPVAGSSGGGFFSVAVRETATQSIIAELDVNLTPITVSSLSSPFSAVKAATSTGG